MSAARALPAPSIARPARSRYRLLWSTHPIKRVAGFEPPGFFQLSLTSERPTSNLVKMGQMGFGDRVG